MTVLAVATMSDKMWTSTSGSLTNVKSANVTYFQIWRVCSGKIQSEFNQQILDRDYEKDCQYGQDKQIQSPRLQKAKTCKL